MTEENSITRLFKIRYPIIQAGMVWTSGWRLASAASNSGCLGLIGSGSMHPEVLQEHIKKCREATNSAFGVNVPLLYPEIEKQMAVIIEEKVPIVFTSAGNPSLWTSRLKDQGIKVVHVVSSLKFAQKAQECGVDAIVAEGFEAGGHNGREETTTMVLIPLIRKETDIPLIAAGGIGSGRSMLAAFALGADGVQIGSRFAMSEESSLHDNFKKLIASSREGDTKLSMKKLTPVRMMKNKFFELVNEAEAKGATREELEKLRGKGRAKRGMCEGDLEEGELEIGQIAAMLKDVRPVSEIVKDILIDYYFAREELIRNFDISTDIP